MPATTTETGWPGQRRRYAELKEALRHLEAPDRGVDAELARLLGASDVFQRAGTWQMADGSPLPAYTASLREAAIFWFKCLHDEPIPQGGPIFICRRLVEEAAELFE